MATKDKRLAAYSLYVSSNHDVATVLLRMLPYLHLKHAQAKSTVEYLANWISGDQLVGFSSKKFGTREGTEESAHFQISHSLTAPVFKLRDVQVARLSATHSAVGKRNKMIGDEHQGVLIGRCSCPALGTPFDC